MLRLIMTVGYVIVIAGLLTMSNAEPSPGELIRRLTEADAGHSIDLRTGNKLEVTLPGNPSAGFQWELANGAASILKQSGQPEFTPASDALGAPGQFTLRFEAVATGQATLQLIYHRPFEQDTPPVQTFEVIVTVR